MLLGRRIRDPRVRDARQTSELQPDLPSAPSRWTTAKSRAMCIPACQTGRPMCPPWRLRRWLRSGQSGLCWGMANILIRLQFSKQQRQLLGIRHCVVAVVIVEEDVDLPRHAG